jgi:DNA-binding transcriptional regulator YiaG
LLLSQAAYRVRDQRDQRDENQRQSWVSLCHRQLLTASPAYVNSCCMVTAKQIRITRERMGESQGKFAERFKVARTTIINWERRGPPKTSYAQQFVSEKLAAMAFEFAKRSRP